METSLSRPSHAEVPIRTVTQADLETVRRINDLSSPAMNSLGLERLEWFVKEAAYFRVAEFGRQIAGFLICLRPEARYASPNLRWFNERFGDFLYIDRVAVEPSFRRRGVASALYRDAIRTAAHRYRMLACEVNVRPLNRRSLAFHHSQSFEAVGSQDHGDIRVQYMVKALPL